jgi:hypothetical protein
MFFKEKAEVHREASRISTYLLVEALGRYAVHRGQVRIKKHTLTTDEEFQSLPSQSSSALS